MPFLTHVTRCPVAPVLLLCAARIDVAADCRSGRGGGWSRPPFFPDVNRVIFPPYTPWQTSDLVQVRCRMGPLSGSIGSLFLYV